jgi:hypothetical protein
MRTAIVFALGLVVGGILSVLVIGQPVEAFGAPKAYQVETPRGPATCFTYSGGVSCVR